MTRDHQHNPDPSENAGRFRTTALIVALASILVAAAVAFVYSVIVGVASDRRGEAKPGLVERLEIEQPATVNERCPDCDAAEGELHELFCLEERCPFCGLQLVTCDCIVTELDLDNDERKVVDEYLDDEVDPLKSIMARWKEALDRKKRIPFRP